ncbi:lamin tail domain-containing protein [Microbacterium keratanolyticum]|uniref:lamin tail domain-containing protein n=1 Tax=Microbacterium keratanolyticum TaxID=67574 RepID=UPI00364342BC
MRSSVRPPTRTVARGASTALAAFALIAPLLAASPAAAAETTPAAAPAPSVRINEVFQNNSTVADAVELTNTGDAAVDLSGWIVKDDKDDRTFAIAAGTLLAPGAFAVITVDDDSEAGFGLGRADTVRVYLPDATTLVDQFAWTDHAPTSYSFCGDGFLVSVTATPGAANDCTIPEKPVDPVDPVDPSEIPKVVVNEVESSDGVPGDWIEFYNAGASAVDLSGFIVRDSDDAHVAVIPAGTSIPAGGFWVAEETFLGYGLGKADSARLFLADGVTLIDSYSWTAVADGGHSPTTFGRCPDGTGAWGVTTAPTKGAPNDCATPVRINEIESNGDAVGDWIELINISTEPVDASGFSLRDSGDKAPVVLPVGTTIAAGGHLQVSVFENFGLGGADAARLFDATDTLIDEYAWTAHAAITWARCPDGTGAFAESTAATPGAANACVSTEPTADVWPGSADITAADVAGTFGSDMSGLAFSADGTVLWAVNNGNGTLHRLVRDGAAWVEDAGWTGGSALRYPDGTGKVDAEGVALVGDQIFVASERNNSASKISRPSVLRYQPGTSAGELVASAEWNLVSDLPVVGANAGLEGIAWIPDADLVAAGFVDESTGAAYDPAGYGAHSGGVFFVALEATGGVYGYVLDADGAGFTRVATIDSGFPGVMELEYDPATDTLWAVCDDTCEGRMAALKIGADAAPAARVASGAFTVSTVVARPAGMPNLNNEGFALSPACTDGARAAVWADDGETDGPRLRACACASTPSGGGPPGAPVPRGYPGNRGAPGTPGTPGGGTDTPGTKPGGGTNTGGSGASAAGALATTGAEPAWALLGAAVMLTLSGAILVIARRRRTES